jgi:aspartate aminotransferase
LGPQNVIDAMTNYQSQSVSSAASVSQKAALAAIEAGDAELAKVNVSLKSRRDFALKQLERIPQIKVAIPEGAFYLWLDIRSTFGSSFRGEKIQNSQDFSKILLDHYFVTMVPGIEFGCEGFARISYVLAEERMLAAFERIQKMISELE